MNIEDQFGLEHLLFEQRKCKICGETKELLNDFEKFESFFWLVIPAASNIHDLLKATTANAA